MQDFAYAARQFRRSPLFFAAASLLIALGIAANTQIFTLVNALLLRPLPVRDPQSVVQLFEIRAKQPPYPYFDYPFLKQVAADSRTLTNVMGQVDSIRPVEYKGVTERCHIFYASDNYFSDLGVKASIGRVLAKGDTRVAVLAYPFWARAFAGDAGVVGQTIRVKDFVYQVVGVLPREFNGTTLDSGPDVWIPYSDVTQFSSRQPAILDDFATQVVARLKPGVTATQAQQEIGAMWGRYMEAMARKQPQYYAGRGMGSLEVRSLRYGLSPMREQSGVGLWLLLAGGGLLLLMVCANVGGLLLARATARDKETALRLAIGASRGRIVRQWLAESLLLNVIAGSLGALIAWAGTPLLAGLLPPARGIDMDPAELRVLTLDLRPDYRVVLFSVLVCAVAAFLVALAPAWRSSRRDLTAALKKTIGDRQRFQTVLCGVQVALCTVLLVGGGLMTRSLEKLRTVDAGFDRAHVAMFSIDTGARGYDARRNWAFQQELLERARTVPGVESAAIATRALMRGIGLGSPLVFPGQRSDGVINASVNFVTPGYFDVMKMRVLNGRELTQADIVERDALANVVVNEAFVNHFYHGENPLGRQFGTGQEFKKAEFQIVGVVNDSKYRTLREIPPPIYYVSRFGPTEYPNAFVLHVRTGGDPRSAMNSVREMIRSIDPEVPVFQAATLEQETERSLWEERLLVAISSFFGAFALALSAIGLYGILAYFVSRSRREIGVRVALGARVRDVVRLVAGRVGPMLVAGLVCGVGLSLVGGRFVRSLLYGVEVGDFKSGGAAVGLLVVVGAMAAAVPVGRALRVAPGEALREE